MPASAARLYRLPPYAFAVIGERIRSMMSEGIDVIRLDIGNPDMPPPPPVIERLLHSAQNPHRHGYSGYKGTLEFRRAIARYYQKRFDVLLNPETEILPLIGSKEGIVNLCLAYLDSGDVALVPDIGYPSYSLGARLAGADVHWMPVTENSGYLPNFDLIPKDIAVRAKILWVNYPNNPTGATVDLDFYNRAFAFCQEYDILLASDNPYVDVTFDGYVAKSVLQIPGAMDRAVEFISFSKTYNMAGWRLGAVVGQGEAITTLLQVKSNMDSGHFHAIYDAGVAAIDETSQEWLEQRNCVYQKRRDRLMEVLPYIGLEAFKPKGSLYVWARVLSGDGQSYAERVLEKAHVSIAPGELYGPGGKQYVRLSLGVSDDRLDEALERLKTCHDMK